MAEDNQEMDYFKEKLFTNFKEAGLHDHLKSQMRYDIIQKIQKKSLASTANKENMNTINQSKENTLNFRILISVVSEFLEFYGYNYTQAVFLPEAKHTNQTLTKSEIIEILHLNKIISRDDPSPILNKIIDFTDRQLDSNKDTSSVQCQTDFEGRNVNLEDKLRNIDYEYLQKIDGERNYTQQSFEEKFTKFKKEYDQRMKAELNSEITRIREFELANIRLDEAEKYRLKMEQYRDELDKVYTDKLQKLREREKDTIERCKQQLKALEAASYDYRQKFLKDFELNKMKEEGLEKQMRFEKENIKAQKERLDDLERDLQQQFKELDEKKTTLKKSEALRSAAAETTSFHTTNYAQQSKGYRESEEDKIALVHLKGKLENEINKSEQYKEAVENYESRNKRLLEENNQINEEVRRLREMKKNLELDLEKTKEAYEILKKSANKDEENLRRTDKQIKDYQEEISHSKAAVQEYKEMMQQRKREQIESNQKFIKEIEFYQNEIEKVEKEREALRRRIQELESELDAAHNQRGHSTSNYQGGETGVQRESLRRTERNQAAVSSHRYQYSPIAEEDEEPLRKLDALEREIQEMRAPRDQHIFGVNRSGGARPHAHSSSPRFERDHKVSRRIDEIEQSPQFRAPVAMNDSVDLKELERQRKNLKNELKEMYGLEDSNNEISRHYEESFSGVGKRDNSHFEHIFDKYTDKMLQESSPIPESHKKLATEGRMKYEDFAPSGAKESSTNKVAGFASKLTGDASRARDIFKVESPSKAKFDVLEELSQRSNKSLIESFTEDSNPKPIMFTKKETIPTSTKPANLSKNNFEEQKKPFEKKVEKKDMRDEPPSTISNKNLSRLDQPKLGELSLPKVNKPAEKSGGLSLPDLKSKGKFQEEPKKAQPRANAAIDAILGDSRKITDEIDFEEIDEELLDL